MAANAGQAHAKRTGDSQPEANGSDAKRARIQGAAAALSVAVSEDKGCRSTMEDVWVAQLDARPEPSTSTTRLCFFAVFDGHGGRSCAAFAAEKLHANVLEAGLLAAVSQDVPGQPPKLDVKAAKRAVTEGFRATDAALLELCAANGWQDGAAAVAVWIVGATALVANVGDAKCVLARASDQGGGAPPGQLRGVTLTKEHKAIMAAERARIERAGGVVSADGRLNGRLQLSRSFGDAQFKKSGASAVPDITAFSLTPRDRFMLVACDGFWGVFDAQGAVDFAAACYREGRTGKGVTNRLLHEAVRERRCKDNVTVMCIHLGGQETEAAGGEGVADAAAAAASAGGVVPGGAAAGGGQSGGAAQAEGGEGGAAGAGAATDEDVAAWPQGPAAAAPGAPQGPGG